MKAFLKGMGTILLLSVAIQAASPVKTADKVLEDQQVYCQWIVEKSTVLNRENDIPTLIKTRRELRALLDRMEREASRLSADTALKPHEDYLLSIEEGIDRLTRLSDEPMNRKNLEEVKETCRSISSMDRDLIARLKTGDEALYRAAR